MSGRKLGTDVARAILRAAEQNTGLLYSQTVSLRTSHDSLSLQQNADVHSTIKVETVARFGDSFPDAGPGDHVLTPAAMKFDEPDAWAYLRDGE